MSTTYLYSLARYAAPSGFRGWDFMILNEGMGRW